MPARIVLIVEDNEQNMELASFLLEEAGYVVRTAGSAEEARRALAAERPDLVLLDMNLAGADGLSVVVELRQNPANAELPVLALTAHAMRGDRERFLEGGCDGYLAKPIEVKTFVQDVEAALRRGRQAQPSGEEQV